ncbi:dinitrogenase iron-molybdenum cofactor biosynthesis protein [Thermosulfidibacter takaii ABI70S6]|uniref:Dinitrogenase iron-molybdenum cofactor biosynthesis protein n=1 Tax=Thermosulfidibacter takaii (strain DSM 17441 / JCM 13301 / NBRC 103674 / ABI70S6) TaxID=1298851 RepID=A0A0S3QUT9_THET7|nr:NifB/NifX family molybdenum-iron cluster-binding protein [Thermosulfidibacter takaii]BAT72104.1 dinitrogenase iron-molybdenum cofactor biosynthesis protein [Thermosulfidibacter takaii ABI70S6]
MKVCVTAVSPGLEAEVDPRFGRAQYFVIVETDTMDCESIPNPNINAVGGAGIQSAQLVAEKGCKVVITGHVGPNAAQALQAAGVKVITGAQGLKVREAIEKFVKGDLKAEEINVSSNQSDMQSLKKEFEELKSKISELEERIKKLEQK